MRVAARFVADFPEEPLGISDLHNIAWQLASSPNLAMRDPAHAVELARKTLELSPRPGLAWNTLGVARYRVGRWSDAVDALKESMRLRSGGDPYDWLFLAMARRQLGEAAEARRWLDRSLAWIETHPAGNGELIRFRAEAARLFGPETPPAP